MVGRTTDIAHRGASGSRPGNLLASFGRVVQAGVDRSESGTCATSDGLTVALHGAAVGRTIDGAGAVPGMTPTDLRSLGSDSWSSPAYADARVPTLLEVVDLICRTAGTRDDMQGMLNPELRTMATPPYSGGYTLKVPAGTSGSFQQ